MILKVMLDFDEFEDGAEIWPILKMMLDFGDFEDDAAF